jgi:Concanavalin A-like lectin/glucanases superfamily/VanZ like family
MVDASKVALELKMVGVLCIFVLSGILVAGLWPFHAPLNLVAWLESQYGLRFSRYGTALATRPFTATSSQEEASYSVEIWLQPRFAVDSATILALYTPESPIQFSLHQSEANLTLQRGSQNEHIQTKGAGLAYVNEVFRARKLVLIAMASGAHGTRLYVNGALVRTAPQFRLSTKDFAGQLVLGTSPIVTDNWSGQIRGLAIYRQELTAAQVYRHFKTWTAKGQPELGQNERVLALYLFDEHQGRIVHDRSGSGIDLYIPERYMILREKFLEPPWREFHQDWGYWKNVLINIGGFTPLGFFFCAYLTLARQMSRPVLVTIALGAVASFTIEALQAYLPTRDSGMTDIITNTLGTSLGVALYRWNPALFSEVLNRVAALRPLAQLASIGERS